MKECILACNAIHNREALHDALAESLCFPDYYGRNLDALADCLSEIGEPTRLILRHWQILDDRLGDYAGKLVYVLHRASEENPMVRIELEG